MKRFVLFFWFTLLLVQSQAQNSTLTNAGTVMGWFPDPNSRDSISGKMELSHELWLVDLYPGFAAVKGEFRFFNRSPDTLKLNGYFPFKGSVIQSRFGTIRFGHSNLQKVMLDEQLVKVNQLDNTFAPGRYTDQQKFNIDSALSFKLILRPQRETRMTLYFLTRNHQAYIQKGGKTRDANGFCVLLQSGNFWFAEKSIGQVFVKFHDQLTLNQVWGILPDSGMRGDAGHLLFNQVSTVPASEMMIWYDGAPPDLKWETKILPLAGEYFKQTDAFPLSEFDPDAFSMVTKTNFETRFGNNFAASLIYFLMFLLPWLILGGLIVYFLVGKRKKKTTETVNLKS